MAAATWAVRAKNTDTASSNKVHDDEVARRLGFRGGLVPGVEAMAYLCHLPAERWGEAWLARGTFDVRLPAPVYDGDEVVATAIEAAPAEDGAEALALELRDPSGALCAIGTATLPAAAPPAPPADAWPEVGRPSPVPDASPEALAPGTALGWGPVRLTPEALATHLDDVREELPLFREGRLGHPGWLLRQANFALAAGVRLGPWIHVGSSLQLHGLVPVGAAVSARARVTAEWERKGHRLVELDVAHVADGEVVGRTRHTAIWRPRQA